jgi:metallo-beta-lactamase class B
MQAEEEGKRHDVVFVCSTSAPGYKLVNNPKYPTIVADYRKSFGILKGLPCDVFLGAHGSFFNLGEKRKLLDRNPHQNPFVDPEGCRRYVRDSEASFDQALRRQQ